MLAGGVVARRAPLKLFQAPIHTGWPGCTFVYQQSMPRLPIPPLHKTCERYLKIVQPILTPEEFARTKMKVYDFAENGDGLDLYDELLARDRAAPHTSYINEWWSQMYLKDATGPLPIHSNPFLQLVDDDRNPTA